MFGILNYLKINNLTKSMKHNSLTPVAYTAKKDRIAVCYDQKIGLPPNNHI